VEQRRQGILTSIARFLVLQRRLHRTPRQHGTFDSARQFSDASKSGKIAEAIVYLGVSHQHLYRTHLERRFKRTTFFRIEGSVVEIIIKLLYAEPYGN
jgi:hypothetical protein